MGATLDAIHLDMPLMAQIGTTATTGALIGALVTCQIAITDRSQLITAFHSLVSVKGIWSSGFSRRDPMVMGRWVTNV